MSGPAGAGTTRRTASDPSGRRGGGGGTFLATVVRGLRSRALLSAGSVLLIALAVGSAVLGPMFSTAVTSSFLVTRLDQAPNSFTGLSWRFSPHVARSDVDRADTQATAAARSLVAPDARPFFADPQLTLESERVKAYGGETMLAAKADACAHLEVTGRCPSAPGEVVVLDYDLTFTGSEIGQTVDLGELGTVTIVGSYRTPSDAEADFWFDPTRYTSSPPHALGNGSTPYQPAPWITVPQTFDRISPTAWSVLADQRLVVPPDFTTADLTRVVAAARALKAPARTYADGTVQGDSINSIADVSTEVRGQQSIARTSIGPAVFSLVLVALALLLRLLTSAADLRLPELALASLRGLTRRRMWQLGLSEPLTLLAVAVPVGAALGVLGALGLIRWWLVPGLPLRVPPGAVVAALVVALGTVVVAVLAVGQVLRVRLSDQLSGVRRPQRSGRWAVVLQLALVAAAAVVLASKLSAGRPGSPDVTDLALPVLLAVVAGVVAVRGTAAVAEWWTRRGRSRSLASFVAARAISRRTEGTLVILPVTAAVAVCVFGAGVYDSASQWRASVAATVAPAAQVYQSSSTMAQTVAVTHRIDPQGRWLMAMSTLSTQGPQYVVADTTRLARVASWPDQWTPGVSPSSIADRLSLHATVPTVKGRTVGFTLDRATAADEQPITLQLRLGAPDGIVRSVFVGPFDQGTATATADVGFCDTGAGCSLQGVTVGGPAAAPTRLNGTLTITGITVDGRALRGGIQGAGWTRTPGSSAASAVTSVDTTADAVKVTVASGDSPVVAQLATGALPAALPVVAGVDATLTPQQGASISSATAFPVRPVVTARSVPLLGPVGLLVDYTTLSTDRTLLDQQAPVYVLARADTPASVLDALRGAGASRTTTLAAEKRSLDQSAYALALRLYAVVAVLVLLMALAGLVVSTAVQLPARRRDAASLRVVGVPRRAVLSAVLRELAFVLGTTAVAGLAAGALAQYVVLRTVKLGYVTNINTPALVAAVDPGRLVLLALLAVVLFGAVAVTSAALTVRGARGSTLRETAR